MATTNTIAATIVLDDRDMGIVAILAEAIHGYVRAGLNSQKNNAQPRRADVIVRAMAHGVAIDPFYWPTYHRSVAGL